MAGKSNIEWTDDTWNPFVGCSIVSPGCTNCYAMLMAHRLQAMADNKASGQAGHYLGTTKKVNGNSVWTGKLALAPDHILTAPLRWKKPRRVFVNSMGDLFHEEAPDEWIDKVFAIMALCPQHTFQVLTKRPERMRAYKFCGHDVRANSCDTLRTDAIWHFRNKYMLPPIKGLLDDRPLPNVWLGTSCERQPEADERIPILLQTPAAVRFVSLEPLLGAIDLANLRVGEQLRWNALGRTKGGDIGCLDWVIVGGESGPSARPFNIEWADALIDQCKAASVPCFVKQLGAVPMSSGYPLECKSKKGGNVSEWPDSLRVREFPEARS